MKSSKGKKRKTQTNQSRSNNSSSSSSSSNKNNNQTLPTSGDFFGCRFADLQICSLVVADAFPLNSL
ncbi:hypothetical protein BcDW1_3107 [Botrytis cinerea BcDW1]|uniref:Uncharacterized protein n=1 Tax=Botryotinia fuckeliana (strain BcDW1) TaxID=1290391 RepID=M7UWS9_BOTF1|nr:hypothetical protein BcDW1_3107 [Botrytis cinerea BcDW1]